MKSKTPSCTKREGVSVFSTQDGYRLVAVFRAIHRFCAWKFSRQLLRRVNENGQTLWDHPYIPTHKLKRDEWNNIVCAPAVEAFFVIG
jgi:hypothetical protein